MPTGGATSATPPGSYGFLVVEGRCDLDGSRLALTSATYSFVVTVVSLFPLSRVSQPPGDCTACRPRPAPVAPAAAAANRVLLYAPTALIMAKILDALGAGTGYTAEVTSDSVAVLTGPADRWESLLVSLEECLTSVEGIETRLAPIGDLPPDPLMVATAALQARPLTALLAESRDDWLVAAIHGRRVTSYLQPIVDVVTGEVFAHEALLRVGLGEDSVVGASHALEVGRRMNLLHVLDQLGRSAAIEAASRLSLRGRLFVNFFPTVVYDTAHCLCGIRAAMQGTNLKPEQIVFEVVESEFVADRHHLANILDQFRADGFGVALDDFGAGHGSLNLLAALRPDFIKLDIGLVREVAADRVRASLVGTMVRVAREANVEVIAEGVEQAETAELLAGLGIRLMQGYLFGRPSEAPGNPVAPLDKAPARP